MTPMQALNRDRSRAYRSQKYKGWLFAGIPGVDFFNGMQGDVSAANISPEHGKTA